MVVIANRAYVLAIAWHVVVALAVVALLIGWRPTTRTARIALVTPLASVAALAFAFGNPFNGIVFAAATIALAAVGATGDSGTVSAGTSVTSVAGIFMIVFGWVYPHFLDGPATAYFYAAPVGLVPCPTLSIAIGFALIGNGLGRRAWSGALAVLGIAYGAFGAIRLGVTLDLALVAGAVTLAAAGHPRVAAIAQ
jgi:hypothetical protein